MQVGAACPRAGTGDSPAGCSSRADGGTFRDAEQLGSSAQLQALPAGSDLSAQRIQSSIPRADCEGSWQYPSPRMFYSAMQRKGFSPDATEMDAIVAIHNVVNEQTWQEVLKWERRACPSPAPPPKLARFMGRPRDLSPRAAFRHYILGRVRPFDRHDWFVERADGTTVRYVIDFYSGQAADARRADGALCAPPPSFHIDARPAIDSPRSLWQRLSFSWWR